MLVSCAAEKSEIILFPESDFNTEVDGKPVSVYTLKAGDVVMQVSFPCGLLTRMDTTRI